LTRRFLLFLHIFVLIVSQPIALLNEKMDLSIKKEGYSGVFSFYLIFLLKNIDKWAFVVILSFS